MKPTHYRALLDYRMCADQPLPSVDMKSVDELLDEEAKERGFEGWIDAYHRFRV